jgi:hypothetical protein
MRATASGRHGNYNGTCLMLQSLDLGKAVLESRWLKDVPNYNDIICNTEFTEEDEADLEDV